MDPLKKLMIAGIATIAVSGALSGVADARPYGDHAWGGGRGFGWGGVAAVPPYYVGRPYYGYSGGGAYYGYPYYGYYGGGFEGCFPRRRVVGYTPHGSPIVRRVRVCY